MMLINAFIILVLLYSLVSGRLEKSIITAPIVFTAAGILVSIVPFELQMREIGLEVFLKIAEVGLVLLLFTDASRTGLRMLKNIRNLPTRLLSIGMLLTILLGGLGALVVFTKLSLWEAGILAAILAPTDAGLGQIIVNSPRVPVKIRQALNVEARTQRWSLRTISAVLYGALRGKCRWRTSEAYEFYDRTIRLWDNHWFRYWVSWRLAVGSLTPSQMDYPIMAATRFCCIAITLCTGVRSRWREHVYRGLCRRSDCARRFQGS